MSLIDDINNLDPKNMGGWPPAIKVGLVAIICGVILFISWQYDIKGLRAEISDLQDKEIEKIGVLERKQTQAANLEALKEQMAEMQRSFGDMLRQLPDKTEVAGLLVDISQTGLAAGLEFGLFKPEQEQPRDFYVELPIQIEVLGSYHELGEFVSGVAALPRIVTVHNITIERAKNEKAGGSGGKSLRMSATAKTYRALEEDEE